MTFGKKARYFKVRQPAASPNVTFVPGELLCVHDPLPETVRRYLACGVLEELEGKPGIGLDVTTITEAMFPAPRVEPEPEKPIHRDQMLKRLGWDEARLGLMRGRYGFPSPCAAFDAHPEHDPGFGGVPGWRWSQVEAWMREHKELAVSLAGK